MRVTFCIMGFPIFRSKNCLFLSDIKSLVEMILMKGSLNRVCCNKLTSSQTRMIKCDLHYNYNRGQKSKDKFALLTLLHTRQTEIQRLASPLTPHTMLKTSTRNISPYFRHCFEWGGGRGGSNAF